MFSGFSDSGSLADSALHKIIESYIRYFAAGTGHTARAKRLDLQHFLDFLVSYRGVSKPEKLKVLDWDFSAVQRFVDESLSKGEAPATVARRLATIKHMGRALAEKVPGFINPAREAKAPKIKSLCPKALSHKQIATITKVAHKRAAQKGSFIRMRNQTIFEFLIDTGLRAEEVRLLKLHQLDDDLQWLKNVKTKGRRFRNVYVTTAMRPKLRTYLKKRALELKRFFPKLTTAQSKSLPLFISAYRANNNKPDSFLMGAKSIWRAVNELSEDVPLHPHLLRHSYAIDLLENSNDVRLVAQALGHSDVRVTMRYTERKDEEVASALERSRKNNAS